MALSFHSPVEGVGYVEIPVLGTTSNVYVVGRPGEALLVDCGGAETAAEVIGALEANGVRPGGVRAIVVTHGHGDHCGGAGALRAWSGAPLCAHLHAAAQMEDPWGYFISPTAWTPNTTAADWDAFRSTAGGPVRVERILREGDVVECAGLRLEVLGAPGHDRGAVVLFERARRFAFVGDLIQGGTDASRNWLGLYTDAAGQRRSLERVAALEPAWMFRGHRPPRAGAEIGADLAAAAARLDHLERALLEALGAGAPRTLAALTRAAMQAVLGITTPSPAGYAAVSVHAVLLDLARRGLVRRTAELEWELFGGRRP